MTDFLTPEEIGAVGVRTLDVPLGEKMAKIRTLTDEEAAVVQAAQFAGWELAIDSDIEEQEPVEGEIPEGSNIRVKVGDVLAGEAEANRLAAAFGLVNPAMKIEAIRKLHPSVVTKIGKEVRAISGLAQTAEEVLEGLRDAGLAG